MLKKHLHLIILILIIIIAYLPFLINNGFLGDFGDPIGQTIPNKYLLINSLKNGELPLWNPFSLLGMPLLSDIQVGTFYLPDLLIFSIFPPVKSHNISVLIHLIFAGMGFYFFFTKLGFSKTSSLTTSILLTTTGSFLTKLVFLNMLETFSYLPWLLLISIQKNKLLPKLGLTLALTIFAGHPIASLYVLLTMVLFNIIYHFKNTEQLLKITLGIGLGFLISSIQLIPFWELKSLSVRDQIPIDEFINGAIPLKELFGFLNPFENNAHYSVDRYIHFGIIAFLTFIASLFFIKKYSKKFKKIYLTGLFLATTGLFLATLGGPQIIGKILSHIPIINLTRVAARFLFIFYFGVSICLTTFLTYLINKNKRLFYILTVGIILNSLLITYIFLNHHKIQDAYKQYEFTNQNILKSSTTPGYFLNSENFLFPNRHYLSQTSNIIGYNPLILKNYHNKIPVKPFGGFSDPDYFINNYNNFIRYGLKYYIFPARSQKNNIINFLKEKKWQPISTEKGKFTIWKNPNPLPFAYFTNDQNKIEKISLKPGKISLSTQMTTADNLIINQSYYPGWEMTANSTKTPAQIYDNLIQIYKVNKPTKNIEINFNPKSHLYALYLSIFGILILILTSFTKKFKC